MKTCSLSELHVIVHLCNTAIWLIQINTASIVGQIHNITEYNTDASTQVSVDSSAICIQTMT